MTDGGGAGSLPGSDDEAPLSDEPVTIGDDEAPLSDEPIGDDEAPLSEEPFAINRKGHPENMRRALALPIMWFLLLTYAATIGAFLAARFIPHDPAFFGSSDLTAAVTAISGLQGLAAAVVGFYFGSKQGDGEGSGSSQGKQDDKLPRTRFQRWWRPDKPTR